MPRLSSYFLPTEREAPADAEAVSHKLMVRAGLVRQVGAGLWSYLPAGWRVHERIVGIVREEMDAIGAQEMLMPVLLPIEPWRRTGRDGIDEMFKLEDRRGAEMVLAMTHEEVVTQHVAQVVHSYRELPLVLYHFQVKERDEPRPRAGVLRTREFIMKDSYSFDRDAEGLERSYELHVGAYDRIFDRCGLEWHRVESDVGMMGGLGAHEYMAPCAAGEDEIALAEDGQAANVEVAASVFPEGTGYSTVPAIEVGNIFKLGTRYSEPLEARYLDEQGDEHPIWMGSYGIGPARIAAAAIEQSADEHGISWPRAIAPFDVHLVGLGEPGEEAHEAAERLYGELGEAGLDVLYDDRDRSAGEKFADAELLGCPLRLTVGRKGIEAGEVEAQVRRGRERRSLPLGEGTARAAAELWRELL